MLWVRILIRATCTTLCDKVCQWLTTGQWFSLCPLVSSTNKTDGHDKTKILLKGALNTVKTNKQKHNLLHFVLKLLIYIWFGYMLHIIDGLIDWPKFVKVMRNSFYQWQMQSVISSHPSQICQQSNSYSSHCKDCYILLCLTAHSTGFVTGTSIKKNDWIKLVL
jgi:hypothetical protein